MGEKEEVLDLIRSVIMSQKGGVLLKDLNRDFKSMTGDHIPYIKLGYDYMEDLLDDIPEVSSSIDSNGQILYTTQGKNCDHLVKLISKQKSTKSKGANKNLFHKNEKPPNFSKPSNHAHMYKHNNFRHSKYSNSVPSSRAPRSANVGRIKTEKDDYGTQKEEEVVYKVGSIRSRYDDKEKDTWYDNDEVYSVSHRKHRESPPPLKHSQYKSDSWGRKRGHERFHNENYYFNDREDYFPLYTNERGREKDQTHAYESSKAYERRKPQSNYRLSMNDAHVYRTNSFHVEPSNDYDDNYNEYYRDRLPRNYDRGSYYHEDKYARDERSSYYPSRIEKRDERQSYFPSTKSRVEKRDELPPYFPSTQVRTSRSDYPRGYRDSEYEEYYEERRPYYPSHDGARSRNDHEDDYYWDVERSNGQKYGGYSGDVWWNDNERKIDVVSGKLVVTIKNT